METDGFFLRFLDIVASSCGGSEWPFQCPLGGLSGECNL